MYRYLSYISDLANWAKSIAIAAVVTAMDFVSPIDNFLVVILSLAFIDTFWGLAADHGDFRKSKFIRSWVYMLVYFLIIIISFWIGVMMDISEDNAKAFVSWITWAMIWFYGTNVLSTSWMSITRQRIKKAPQIQKDRGAGCKKRLYHACHRL